MFEEFPLVILSGEFHWSQFPLVFLHLSFSLLFLKDIFTGYRILSGCWFSLHIWKMLCHFLWPPFRMRIWLSLELVFLCKSLSFFSAIKIFYFLSLVFRSVIMMTWCEFLCFFEFLLSGICTTDLDFAKFGEFSAIISSIAFSVPLSLPSPSGTLIIWVLDELCSPVFPNLFSSQLFGLGVFYYSVLKFTDFYPLLPPFYYWVFPTSFKLLFL